MLYITYPWVIHFITGSLYLLTTFTHFITTYPGGSDNKESACNAGNLSLILGLGRYPREGNGYPLQYSCLDNFMDRGTCWAIVHGVTKESDTTEQLNNKDHMAWRTWGSLKTRGTIMTRKTQAINDKVTSKDSLNSDGLDVCQSMSSVFWGPLIWCCATEEQNRGVLSRGGYHRRSRNYDVKC